MCYNLYRDYYIFSEEDTNLLLNIFSEEDTNLLLNIFSEEDTNLLLNILFYNYLTISYVKIKK